jgi:hypothetical protein
VSKDSDFWRIAPEFPLFLILEDPTVSLVAYKPLKPKNSSEKIE